MFCSVSGERLRQHLVSKSRLLPEHSLVLVMSHNVTLPINNRNSRHLSAFAHNIPVVFFMSIKSVCLLSSAFNNGSFLARHAVSQQSTLLGPTAGCAVLIINSAGECRLCSALIYLSLVDVHVGTRTFLCVRVCVVAVRSAGGCELIYLSVTPLLLSPLSL